MSYVEQVLKAAGGHAAPEEALEEAALEKNPGDPCWEGYVQVGMKEKDGEMVPNCVPADTAEVIEPPITPEGAAYIISDINSQYGESRRLSDETAYTIVERATQKFSDLEEDAKIAAIMSDLMEFAEYATAGFLASGLSCGCYNDLLPDGHPANEGSSLTASAAWLAGAPELSESSREAVYTSLTSENELEVLHSSVRVKALIASGSLSEHTLKQIERLSN